MDLVEEGGEITGVGYWMWYDTLLEKFTFETLIASWKIN